MSDSVVINNGSYSGFKWDETYCKILEDGEIYVKYLGMVKLTLEGGIYLCNENFSWDWRPLEKYIFNLANEFSKYNMLPTNPAIFKCKRFVWETLNYSNGERVFPDAPCLADEFFRILESNDRLRVSNPASKAGWHRKIGKVVVECKSNFRMKIHVNPYKNYGENVSDILFKIIPK